MKLISKLTDKQRYIGICAGICIAGCLVMYASAPHRFKDLYTAAPLLLILAFSSYRFSSKNNSVMSLLAPLFASILFAAVFMLTSMTCCLDPTVALPDGSYPFSLYSNVVFDRVNVICSGAVLSVLILTARLKKVMSGKLRI